MSMSAYGAAVVITESTAPKLSILNGRVVPEVEEDTLFVYPYNPNASCEIMSRADFNEKYCFANTEDPEVLVDINWI